MTTTPTADGALPFIAAEVHQWQDAICVRQRDVRELRRRLAVFGLSSLGRSEPHVQATLNAIGVAVQTLVEHGRAALPAAVGVDEGQRVLRRRTAHMFGAQPARRRTRIMVTLPTGAATDFGLVVATDTAGPKLREAVTSLDDILHRMSAHHDKKTALMRPLLSWQRTRTVHDVQR